jgi:hypothetical protein
MRRSAVRAVLVATLVLVPALNAGATDEPAVRAPRSGSQYHGAAHHVTLRIAGRSIEIIAFSFRCRATSGRIALDDIRLIRSSRGYRFYAVTHGSVTYRDGTPDQNAEVHIRGLFTRDARVVRGRFRVRSRHCGDTGRLRWRAARVRRLA